MSAHTEICRTSASLPFCTTFSDFCVRFYSYFIFFPAGVARQKPTLTTDLCLRVHSFFFLQVFFLCALSFFFFFLEVFKAETYTCDRSLFARSFSFFFLFFPGGVQGRKLLLRQISVCAFIFILFLSGLFLSGLERLEENNRGNKQSVCIYIYMYIYVCIYTYTYIYVYVYVYI